MKNLITDKPAPITVKLAQKSGVPVLVDPVIHEPTGAESESLDMNIKVGYDEVSTEKKKAQEKTKLVEDLNLNMTVGGDNVKAVQTQQLSEDKKHAIKEQAQHMMASVKTYCECQNHHLAQKKQNNETYETGDEVCTPVAVDTLEAGIDCTMDGYNVTTEALEGLLTDRESPITLPLDAQNVTEPAVDSTLVQTKGEGEDLPTDEEKQKAEEEANSAKNVAFDTINALATNELKKQGIVEKSAETKMQDPMTE